MVAVELVIPPSLSLTVNVTVRVPAVEYTWVFVTEPEPDASVTVPLVVVLSPQSIDAMCVSCVPGSVNDALSETVAPIAAGLGVSDGVETAGGVFTTVTVVVSLRGVLMPSSTVIVTLTSASSSHVRTGDSVDVPVKVHTVPGPAVTMVRVHEIVSESPSGSAALAPSV